jgi:MoaD family protein
MSPWQIVRSTSNAQLEKKGCNAVRHLPGSTDLPFVNRTRPMKVRVQFYAQLRDLAGEQEMDVDLPPGSTVRDLLQKIYTLKPPFRGHDKTILIGAGVEFVDRDYELKSGQEIAIMPPVQGG